VLVAQAGFATPAQVVAAASSRLLARDGRSLLDHLVDAGVLTSERRQLVEGLAREALAARAGDAQVVLQALGGQAAVERTFRTASIEPPDRKVLQDTERSVPVERPGNYTRIAEIGRGGQSVVWRAMDEFIGRQVALKELLPARSETQTPKSPSPTASRERFLREARLTARLDHPGIVAVHDLAQREDGTLFCTQKLIRGETLKAALFATRSLQERLALLPHVVDACQAIAYAHSHGVVHRDIKPSNIMLSDFGETVVLDWGLAKERGAVEIGDAAPSPDPSPELTVAGVALGTPAYMSPEQARGDIAHIDARSDVFNLGGVLYEVITGRPPFEGATASQVIGKVLAGDLKPVRLLVPDAPPELTAICERALDRDPERRYPDAGALAKELSAFRAGGMVSAYTYQSVEKLRKFVARHRTAATALAAALCVALLGAVVVAVQLHRARLNLASALLERARDAQRMLQWGQAAAYYAASRTEHDTRQARWGLALVEDRIPERFLALRGAPGSIQAVSHLDDGSLVLIGVEQAAVVARALEGSHELWRHPIAGPLDYLVVDHRLVRVSHASDRLDFLDLRTGNTVDAFAGVYPCSSGPPTRQALVDRARHLHLQADGVEQRDVEVVGGVCSVSDDGQQIAFRDAAGTVHLWDLGSARELATRPAPDAEQLLFTHHGLAVVRSRSVHVFGGPDGDFIVELPGRLSAATLQPPAARGHVVSPDGHMLALASPASNQVELVDLRERAVIASVSYPPGRPVVTFSPDGQRLFVSGLVGGSLLLGWNLTRPAPLASGGEPGPVFLRTSSNGRRFTLFRYAPPRSSYEVRDVEAGLIRSAKGEPLLNVSLSGDGRLVAEARPDRVDVLLTDTGRKVSSLPCQQCFSLDLTDDGMRLVAKSRDFFGMMSVDPPAVLWSENARPGTLGPGHSVSGDGRVIAWIFDRRALVRVEGSPNVLEFSSEHEVLEVAVSKDGTQLITVTPAEISEWDIASHRPVWTVPNGSWVKPLPRWSTDGTIIVLFRESQGTTLLDARTGEQLATVEISRPGALFSQENVLFDLQHRILRGNGLWELHRMPRPDDTPPRASLKRVLARTGLELREIDLVDAIPPAPPGASTATR
jgi:tRNA A-37 threonylcarbamoyl transferase component Bud32/WD40 repeat protein